MATLINGRWVGNGVNLQPSYYANGNVNFAWGLMQQFSSIKTVRIEIEPDKVNVARQWIAQAQSQGYTVIACYHKYTVLGSSSVVELIQAAQWWQSNYQALGGNFIINLMNEWGPHNMTPQDYASAYNQAISIVRSVYTGQIVIDLPGWGQDSSVAATAARKVNPLIKDRNIVLSAHIYKSSWNGATNFNTADIDKMMATGLPCIIGEFGPIGNGGCNWSACVDYASRRGLAILGWCWNGDGQNHNMLSPSWAVQPSAVTYSKNQPYFDDIYNKLNSIQPMLRAMNVQKSAQNKEVFALRFGPLGHKTIGMLAEKNLTPKAATAIKTLLKTVDRNSLQDVASWADEIKHKTANPSQDQETQDFLNKFPKTDEWHYVNLPTEATEYNTTIYKAFTREDDVVHTMVDCIDILTNKSTKYSKVNALRWLVHLIGDIHQPLHVGCGYIETVNDKPKLVFNPQYILNNHLLQKSDRGGNKIILPNNNSLHEYWDTKLVKLIPDLSKFTPIEQPNTTANNLSKLPAQWVTDTLQVSKYAYAGLNVIGKNADHATYINVSWNEAAYNKKSTQILKKQINLAASRLAFILNKVF